MTIQYFGANRRNLLGALHVTPRLRAGNTAVLLCNPFGEEAARAHRAYRVLAGRLQEAGYTAMRFDYSGTGDSAGDITDFGIEDWLDDIQCAVDELRRQSGSQRIVLVGLRLGATLAALYAGRENARVTHLVLWDPVTNGARYLQELGSMHEAYMRSELGEAKWRVPPRDDVDAGVPTEALGIEISAGLATQLAVIDLTLSQPRATHTTVVCTRHSEDVERHRSQWQSGPALRWIDVMDGTSWNSDAALNSNVVPAKEIAAIVSRIRECSP